jgi:hypothetical protein
MFEKKILSALKKSYQTELSADQNSQNQNFIF